MSLSAYTIVISDIRLLGITITLFFPAQDVLDIRSLEQPLIHSGLGLSERTKDYPVEFVREL